jgi:phage shock protein PspC (stress-responsive transcriptional regulator)
MGRPEDFEQEEAAQNGYTSAARGTGGSQQNAEQPRPEAAAAEEPRRLFRSENDKIFGGVCGGLASYLRVDPAIVRILFALITFGAFGSGLLIYFILWIVLPSKSLAYNFRKRLYRNPDNRVIAGVASGLAAYFHLEVWVPRLIFSLPLIFSVLTSLFRHTWFYFDPAPVFIAGGFGGTMIVTYIILWIVLPEAQTASEKLEMRGEKVDIESIKNTVKSDLEGVRTRAADFGDEIKARAQQFGSEFKQATQQFAAEAAPVARRTGTGIGHAIGVLFKAFFLFVAGVLAFALIMVLIGLIFSGMGVLPFRNYMLSGFWQNALAWLSLVLFLGIPIIALITWLIRRIIGVRTRNHYLGYIFGSLWVIGLVCTIALIGSIVDNFRTQASVESEVPISQPPTGKMVVKMTEERVNYYGSDWFGFDWNNDAPFYGLREDSVMMTTVRINLARSSDSMYHIRLVRFSHGNNPVVARDLAARIQFPVKQSDSIFYLPPGFAITPNDKFRNQRVLVVVLIPIGRRILVDRNTESYHWFTINVDRRRRGWNWDWNEDWNDSYSFENNVEYVMTSDGLKRTARLSENDEDSDQGDKRQDGNKSYRYKGTQDNSHQPAEKHPKHEPVPPHPRQETKPAADSTGIEKKVTANPSPSGSADNGREGTIMMNLLAFASSY